MAFVRHTMRQIRNGLLLATAVFLASSLLHAQAVESADGPGGGLWAGGQCSYFIASFPYLSGARLIGAGAFADYHLHGRLGIEAEAHFLWFNGFYGESERNYLGGVQYRVGRFNRIYPFAQFSTGIGHIHFPFKVGDRNYLVLAPSGGADYRLARRWTIRAEVEYQLWTPSPNYVDEPSHPFRPFGVRAGVAYRLRR